MERREDIQGLRAVAVLLVVLCHAGVGFLAGGFVGVDVFFVLSGFLITGVLLAGVRERGYVSLGDFYARRARRILPAAGLTLVATIVASYFLLNLVRAKQYLIDSVWAALFAANFRFADLGTDYFAATAPPSPVQQFWTLAVEEQFYLAWPLVLAGLLGVSVLASRRSPVPRDRRRVLGVGIACIGIASFAWSVHGTSADPVAAYFSSLGRAWELALGAGLALAAPALARTPHGLRLAAGWVGAAAILAAAVLYTDGTPYPGIPALLPTMGAAMVIAAGLGRTGPRGVARVLSPAGMRYVGDRSYALYLWHWPVLVIAAQVEGRALGVGTNLLLVLVAFGISVITYATVENPIRRRREWRLRALALWPAVAGVVVAVAAIGLLRIDDTEVRLADAAAATSQAEIAPSPSSGSPAPLAEVVAAAERVEAGAALPEQLSPSPGRLLEDRYYFEAGCAPEAEETSAEICPRGDPGAQRSLVVFGDSKAQMWMTALESLGEREGWRVLPIVKSSCTPSAWVGLNEGQVGPQCEQWFDWAMGRIEALAPEAVLIAGNYGEHTANAEYNDASAAGIELARSRVGPHPDVVVVGDVPGHSSEPIDCILATDASMSQCSTELTSFQAAGTDLVERQAKRTEAGFVDPTGWVCAEGTCPMVIGTTIAYADRGHLSRTYVERLRSVFAAALRPEIGRGSG